MSKENFFQQAAYAWKTMFFSLLCICVLALSVMAQDYGTPDERQEQQQDPWGQQQGMPNDFSDEEIEQVAHAYVDIIEIRDEYQEKLMEVDEPEAAQEIQMEANEKITEAVEARGIDVETYNNVITAAQGDETLMNELLQKIDEIQQ